MSKRVEFYEGRDGGWRWRVVARNGKITAMCAEGDGFVSLWNCQRSWWQHLEDIGFGFRHVVVKRERKR